MAKLENILGAILSDITKAQAISDAYSRDLKSSYRDDPSLKLLSVPRTEIKDVTLDLKFVILKTGTEELSKQEVTLYPSARYKGDAQSIGEGNYDVGLKLAQAVGSLKVPEGLRVTIYEETGFAGRSRSFIEDTPWVGEDFNIIPSSIKVEQNLMADMESVEIEVVTDRLATLPEAAISSIAIKLDMTSA